VRRRPVVGIAWDDDDVPVEPELLAVVLANVRVVPVDAGVRAAHAVLEALADGHWPLGPLGDYLAALDRTIELDPEIALPGHGDPIDDPAGRARELKQHHRDRLEAATEALGAEPQTGYELSFALFGSELPASGRRFAIAETLSHLERLVREGAARRAEDDGAVTYTAP
jgi:glyoxylase-like metal-dependent hydrolase (beta-lactamase superfamily II)